MFGPLATSIVLAPLAVLLAVAAALRPVPWAVAAICGGALIWFAAAVADAARLARRTRGVARRLAVALATLVPVVVVLGAYRPVEANLLRSFRSPTSTMAPTLTIGDHFVVDLRRPPLRRGDVVVFQASPKDASEPSLRTKRVIGLAGDTVELRDGTVLVNGAALPARQRRPGPPQEWEETLDGRRYHVLRLPGAPRSTFAPITVPAGHFFMLGDNRDDNNDSRRYGPIAVDMVIGRVVWIWWSRAPDGTARWDRLGRRL